MPNALPVFPPHPGPGDFLRGLLLPVRAARLLLSQPRLRNLALLSGAVTCVALGGVLWVLTRYTGDFVSWAFFARPESWYGAAGWYLLSGVTFLLGLVIGAQVVPLVLLAPLQDPLSEAAEAACGGAPPPPFELQRFLRGAWVSLSHNVTRVALLLGGHALLLPLNLLPGIGSGVWTVLATAWTVFWLAAEYLDGVMARHFYGFREVLQAVRGRTALAAGFGLSVHVLLWVPILNFFFVPVAVVAGTLCFCGLRAVGAIRAPGNARGT